MTSTRRCWPLTSSVIRRSTAPGPEAGPCACTAEARNRYAAEDTVPPAITPLIRSRLDNVFEVDSGNSSIGSPHVGCQIVPNGEDYMLSREQCRAGFDGECWL